MSENRIVYYPMVKVSFPRQEGQSPIIGIAPTPFPIGSSIDKQLETLYNVLDCYLVEAIKIEIAGHQYVIFSDEEAKLKRWVPTLPLYHNGKCYDVIANSFIITKEDKNENLLPLEPEETKAIIRYLQEEIPKAAEEVRKVVAAK